MLFVGVKEINISALNARIAVYYFNGKIKVLQRLTGLCGSGSG
jgi:hypothetical protein